VEIREAVRGRETWKKEGVGGKVTGEKGGGDAWENGKEKSKGGDRMRGRGGSVGSCGGCSSEGEYSKVRGVRGVGGR